MSQDARFPTAGALGRPNTFTSPRTAKLLTGRVYRRTFVCPSSRAKSWKAAGTQLSTRRWRRWVPRGNPNTCVPGFAACRIRSLLRTAALSEDGKVPGSGHEPGPAVAAAQRGNAHEIAQLFSKSPAPAHAQVPATAVRATDRHNRAAGASLLWATLRATSAST